uniref:Dermatopontin n=1 Tax=Pinctada imbricata TaxID=66713 RepID=I3UIB6_PINIB|nr:dermatopontin [Pinctada imbricata]
MSCNIFGLIIFFVFTLNRVVKSDWINNYDNPVDFECHHTKTISYWRSIFNIGPRDRVFDLRCGFMEQTTALNPSCYWTDYVNDWDEPFDFTCPNHGYINGFRSVHDNYKEDRRMKFRCCNLPGMCVYNCQRTSWVNDYGEEVLHTVPVAQILHGVKSRHDNQIEDRLWDFTTCYYMRC